MKREFTPPERPAHFNKTECEVWDKTVEILRLSMAPLREIDGAVLGAYVSTFVRWQVAEREIQKASVGCLKRGLCSLDSSGKPRAISPLVTISRDAQRDMVYYAAQLGMTPASRIRIISGAMGAIEKNPFAKLKDRKNDVDRNRDSIRQGSDQPGK